MYLLFYIYVLFIYLFIYFYSTQTCFLLFLCGQYPPPHTYTQTCTQCCEDVVSRRTDLLGEERNAAAVRCYWTLPGLPRCRRSLTPASAFLISKPVRPLKDQLCCPAWLESRESPNIMLLTEGEFCAPAISEQFTADRVNKDWQTAERGHVSLPLSLSLSLSFLPHRTPPLSFTHSAALGGTCLCPCVYYA